jgi:hypothetical protein
MREPIAVDRFEDGTVLRRQVYSELRVDELKNIAAGYDALGGTVWSVHPEPDYDPDFRRRYAAILLRERGL